MLSMQTCYFPFQGIHQSEIKSLKQPARMRWQYFSSNVITLTPRTIFPNSLGVKLLKTQASHSRAWQETNDDDDGKMYGAPAMSPWIWGKRFLSN